MLLTMGKGLAHNGGAVLLPRGVAAARQPLELKALVRIQAGQPRRSLSKNPAGRGAGFWIVGQQGRQPRRSRNTGIPPLGRNDTRGSSSISCRAS